jgi:fido (protein-threonine AMPylation protein)
MPFDPVSWAVGFAATKTANTLVEKIFDVGAYGDIQKAAMEWAAELPEDIRTPSQALFDVEAIEQSSQSRSKLKEIILELHKVPTEEEWFDALIESWEFKRKQLGTDANSFFQLRRPAAEQHLRRLSQAIFTACASVLKYSQPLIVVAVREIGITQSAILRELRTFRSPLNNTTAGRNEGITFNFDPTHIEEQQLQLLNEILCVDSPSEVIAGRYRTHELWIGPDGCSKENATYVPLAPKYIPNRMRSLLAQWNRVAVDLAKLDSYSVTSALASFHHKFLEVHPFPDGNGRVARAILDLQVRNFTSARSPLRLKTHIEYYFALKAADEGRSDRLQSLITSILQKDLDGWQ